MASVIRIKRSSGTSKPASLQWGEMAYVTGIGSYGGNNQYKDRVFLGDDGTNVNPVGGHYYTSMMEHSPGNIAGVSNTRNSDGGIVAILDSNRKVDLWNVDNLRLDGNTLSSTDTDGDITLDANGTGEIVVPDDSFFTFGTGKDVKFEYDEDSTDRLQVTGAPITYNNTTESTSKITGSAVFKGGVGVEKNLNVGGSFSSPNGGTFDKVEIKDNIISTLGGSGNLLYLDPYPDGLSNEGTVIIKGSLQVDGTTTSVNSTVSTLNDPIMHLGDLTSDKTVMTTAAVGVSTLRLDSLVGIATGDVISGSPLLGLSGVGTVTTFDLTNKIVTIDVTVRAPGISTTTQLTVTHARDTQTDRGISFGYNTSVGVGNNKLGFFGYTDQSQTGSSAPDRSWTYIPDASLANSLVTGTRGFLDIKGIYYQTGDYNTHGVVYFDANGLQSSTNAPTSPVITSKQVMVAITKNTLTTSGNVTLAVGDIVKQDTSGAYGVVETAVNAGNSVPLVGVEGTFNTTNNLRKEGNNGAIANLSVNPSAVNVNYSNKPSWTSTLDGGTF
tara:strand:- start:3954 stop:5612 length:1659 start_codon:yes stop_codon:yes gene_type:complete